MIGRMKVEDLKEEILLHLEFYTAPGTEPIYDMLDNWSIPKNAKKGWTQYALNHNLQDFIKCMMKPTSLINLIKRRGIKWR